MKKIMSYAYVTTVNPCPAFAGLAAPTKLMAYDYLVVAGSHVKDDVVYRIAKAMYENKPKLVESLARVPRLQPRRMYKQPCRRRSIPAR